VPKQLQYSTCANGKRPVPIVNPTIWLLE